MGAITRRLAESFRGPGLAEMVERRDVARPFNQAGQIIPTPGGWTGVGMLSGLPWLTTNEAFGMTAVSAAVRVVAETVAALPFLVYEGRAADKRLADDTWQYALLAESPAEGLLTPFDFMVDIASSIESRGNAFVRKVRVGGEVLQLLPIDPDIIRMRRDQDTGEKVFEIYVNGHLQTFGTDEILHIRGPVLSGGQLSGYDPIMLHQQALGVARAQEEFVGRFFVNDARPGQVVSFPNNVTAEQAKAYAEMIDLTHGGVGNAHKTMVIGGGAQVTSSPVSMSDAEMTSAREYATRQVAEIFRVPANLLTGDFSNQRQTTEQVQLMFLNNGLLPRLKRIEDAFRADRDLFPLGSRLSPEFDTREFLRVDAATQATVDHQSVQAGIETRNEIRAQRGLAPLPPNPADPSQHPGDVVPELPVGAGPNSAGSQTPGLDTPSSLTASSSDSTVS